MSSGTRHLTETIFLESYDELWSPGRRRCLLQLLAQASTAVDTWSPLIGWAIRRRGLAMYRRNLLLTGALLSKLHDRPQQASLQNVIGDVLQACLQNVMGARFSCRLAPTVKFQLVLLLPAASPFKDGRYVKAIILTKHKTGKLLFICVQLNCLLNSQLNKRFNYK